MASGTIKNPRPYLYYLDVTATTNATGDIVLGQAYNTRLIQKIEPVNAPVFYVMGNTNPSPTPYIHFMNYDSTPLVSTQVTFRVYWFEKSDFALVPYS